MNRIGFKTQYMEREERMPVVYENKAEEPDINSEELITAMMRQRIRKQALDLLDGYLFGCTLPGYTFTELENLKQVVLTIGK